MKQIDIIIPNESKLDSNEPLMMLDIGNMERYERQDIPGSACTVCNDESKRDIMPSMLALLSL